MPDKIEETIGTLAVTLVALQERQKEAYDFNMKAFQRIMDKVDVLPTIQTNVAVLNEKIGNMNAKFDAHVTEDHEKHLAFSEDLKDLQKEKWIRHGISLAVGAISGFFASLIGGKGG